MRQFVHLQDSSWRSLFRNSNFSAQCRIVSASRQICTVPHVLSDRPAYPLPVILPIPLLLKSRKRGRCFNRCIYPSEAVRQRSVRPYDTADTAGKLSYPGRPSACHTRNGFDRVYRILQQLFSRLSTASQLPQPPGQKALHPLPSEQNAPKRHFTENERPDILNRTVPCPVYRTNVRQAAKNPSAHRRKQSLSFRKQTIPPPLHAVCNHFTVAPL